MGLWHEITTASGVSSIIISTPVAASIARMLRPSRPMIRPFISSLGSAITETVRSATNSPASRSIAIATTRLARRSASSRASSSTIRMCLAASVRAEPIISSISERLASSRVRPATASSLVRASSICACSTFFLVGETFLMRRRL